MLFDHGHALLIGVGTYQHTPRLNVPQTVADAQALATLLCDPQYCGYPEEHVTLLSDGGATRDGILGALDRLAAATAESDIVLLFYSGHGHYGDDGTYYLTSHDTRLAESRKVVAGTAVSQQELLTRLQALRARRVLLVFNACHAGEVSPTLDAEEPLTGQSLPHQTAAALLATGAGRVIITACRERQYSFVGGGALTIFAQALIDGLRGQGVSSQRGYISAFDLYTQLYFAVGDAVKQQIPAAVRQRYGEAQEPELTVLKGVGPFAVALYRGATTPGEFDAPGQPPGGTAVREVSSEESQRAFQQIQSGGINFGQQNQVHIGGAVIGGDNINAQESQGFVNRPGGPVTQHNVNTGGGDYAGGNIDKRQGAFISGGTLAGTVIGYNEGPITIGGSRSNAAAPDPLQQVLVRVQQGATHVRQRGDDDLADDLEGVALALQAALKAQGDGKAERRLAKLREAQQALRRIAAGHPALQDLVQMLDQLV